MMAVYPRTVIGFRHKKPHIKGKNRCECGKRVFENFPKKKEKKKKKRPSLAWHVT